MQIALSGTVLVNGAGAHPHALRRLRDCYPDIDWQTGHSTDRPIIDLRTNPLRAEGSFAITVDPSGPAPRVTVEGGPFSGVIFAVEDLVSKAGSHAARFMVDTAGTTQTPGLTYRTFWTWDHSTNWELSQIGQQRQLCGRP